MPTRPLDIQKLFAAHFTAQRCCDWMRKTVQLRLLKSPTSKALWLVLAGLSACTTTSRAPTTSMVLNLDTVRLKGWFSAKGEWTLFPMSDFEKCYPYVKEEQQKCVS